MSNPLVQYQQQIPDARARLGLLRMFEQFMSTILAPPRVVAVEAAPTSNATAGNITITAAMVLGGILVRDPAGAGRTDTFDTAANLVLAMRDAKVGDLVNIKIVNGADAAETITLAAGSGGGFDTNQTVASRVIAQNNSKTVTLRITNITPGSEAYVIYA